MRRWVCLLLLLFPSAALAQAAQESGRGPARVALQLDWGPQTNPMAQWHAGIADLENLAQQRGLEISSSSNPGLGSQVYATLLVRVARSTWVGARYGRVDAHPRFDVIDAIGFGLGNATFETSVDAYSLVGALVVKHYLNEGRYRPHVEVALGRGSGQVNFDSPGASAHGDGSAPIVAAMFGVEAGIVHLGIGGQYHRYDVSYDTPSGGDPGFPPLDRYWFGSADELRAFVGSRNVDQSGVFVRLGLDLRMMHEDTTPH